MKLDRAKRVEASCLLSAADAPVAEIAEAFEVSQSTIRRDIRVGREQMQQESWKQWLDALKDGNPTQWRMLKRLLPGDDE